MTRHVVRLVAAVLLTAAAGLGVTAPARASSCSTAHGVTVVVDFHELGGGAQSACDGGGGGRNALTQLTDVGHQLTFVQRQPGFVCRVDGAPAGDPCVNTPPSDAYWGLWWSDGKSGTWVYSSAGAGSLTVPDGGYVALSWQGSDSKAPPGVKPSPHRSAPPPSSPTSSPTHKPSSAPPPAPTSSAPSSSPTARSSASPSPSRSSASPTATRHHASKTPEPSPPASRTDVPATAQAAEPPDTSAPGSGSGLPGWLAPVLVAALFVVAAVVAVVRRNRTGGA